MTQSVEDESADSPSTVTEEARVRPWVALTNPQFRLLWIGQAFGSVGQPMREVANLWVVWELSGSALQLGLIGLFRALPIIVLSFVGGTLADMVGAPLALLGGSAACIAAVCAIAAGWREVPAYRG